MMYESNAQPESGRRYVAGIDWGHAPEYTCIAIIDASNNQLIVVVRFNQRDYSHQRDQVRAVNDKWKLASIWAETVGIGLASIEALQSEGLPMRCLGITAANKRVLLEDLRWAIERGDLVLPPEIEAKVNQFWETPREQNDVVIALALSWYGIRHSNVRVDFV